MDLTEFIRWMPKVELHVHLEGSIHPATLLWLARKNHVPLPADTVEGLRDWYTFTDFDHFLEIYLTICECIRTPRDIEMIAREFLMGQAAQNILYSEVTYTPYTHYRQAGLRCADQLAALDRARRWAQRELGVSMNLILDISREVTLREGRQTARWAVKGMDQGVVALGLGGPEPGNPPEKFAAAFATAARAGLPAVTHAGETGGPASIWGALESLHAVRIGHGVRCLEDPTLVAELRRRQTPLEVCPSSNIRLKVFDSLAAHPLPQMMAEGLVVTLNSDDPPLFNTSLTYEYLNCAQTFGWDARVLQSLVSNAVEACLLPEAEKADLRQRCEAGFARLQTVPVEQV